MTKKIQNIGNFELRDGQKRVLDYLKKEQTVFASLPTGYGKSLTYFLPAALWNWKVWVVSPLNSLIQDQIAAASSFGLKSFQWNEKSFSTESLKKDLLVEGTYNIAFFSPERIERLAKSSLFHELEHSLTFPDLLVLDELHCFEQWRDFRTSYQEILYPLRKVSGNIPVLGLSATLSEVEGVSWLAEIGKTAKAISVGLGRENLGLRFSPQSSNDSFWLDLVEQLKNLQKNESCIIYCRERYEADSVAQFLRSLGLSATSFHAGKPIIYKSEITRIFREGKISILCATSAFGMGIDYPKVRKVIHLSPPPSISALWQEVGRAGRDGKFAEAILYFKRSDIALGNFKSRKEKLDFFFVWQFLWQKKCRKATIAEFFGMQEKNCKLCDWCLRQSTSAKEFPWWTQEISYLKYWVKKKIFFTSEKS
jgi:ATP-dependent DNA helicase RecQ